MKETFKDIIGYEGKYQVSNVGNVKSLNYKLTGKPKILKSRLDKGNYLIICLRNKYKKRTFKVHRLVMQAFHGESKLQVNHKNGIKTDNRLENLEYCTPSENQLHSYCILKTVPYTKGKFLEKSKCAKKINQYDLDGNFIRSWDCMKTATIKLGYPHSSISSCCAGWAKSAKGFIWKYK